MTSILFVYGTVGGNTQMAVESVAAFLEKSGRKTIIQRAEHSKPEELLNYDVVVLASPTYGHGLLESSIAKFVEGLAAIKLAGKPCAVMGLGDPKYEAQYHLESASLLEKAITDAGGKLLLTSLKISGTPVRHLKGWIANWAEQLLAALENSKSEIRNKI